MIDDLKLSCTRLNLEDKVELREYLTTLIACDPRGHMIKTPFRCRILLGVMSEIMGDEISYVSRTPMHVWARTMVAYQMIQEGYSTTEIGHQMSKDHSSITHLKDKMEDALDLPYAYKDILEIWDKFQKQIQS